MKIGEFRRHKRSSSRSFFSMVITIAVICALIIAFWEMFNDRMMPASAAKDMRVDKTLTVPDTRLGARYDKPGFILSYVEQYELPEWVTYTLTKDMLTGERLERTQDFVPDDDIVTGSAHYRDYKGSGYRRGHLVPAADMSRDAESMNATFLMSNIAPMTQAFNDGIWLELEHHVRDWARKHGDVQVITGPVMGDWIDSIGTNTVMVPRVYYKAVFTDAGSEPRVIGFLFDQTEDEPEKLPDYVVPVDSLEKLTGVDFFANRYGSWDKEIELEGKATSDRGAWPWNEHWYRQRLEADRRR